MKELCRYVLTIWVNRSGPIISQLRNYRRPVRRYQKSHDLDTIQKKLVDGFYRSIDQFCSDVNLTSDNAMMYNKKRSIVHDIAKEFKTKFETEFIHAKKGGAAIAVATAVLLLLLSLWVSDWSWSLSVTKHGKAFRTATNGSLPEWFHD